MNKKFLSAILFGALAVASTGSFVSCKDYDDEIDNLQTQINGLASAKDLSDKVSQLQSAITAAQKAAEDKAAAAEAKAAEAKKAADDAAATANTAVAEAKKAAADEAEKVAKELRQEADDLKAEVEKTSKDLQKLMDDLKEATEKDIKDLTDQFEAYKKNVEKTLSGSASSLKSIVFQPELYIDGIESAMYTYLQYAALTPKMDAWTGDKKNDLENSVSLLTDADFAKKTDKDKYTITQYFHTGNLLNNLEGPQEIAPGIGNDYVGKDVFVGVVDSVKFAVNPASAEVTREQAKMIAKNVIATTRAHDTDPEITVTDVKVAKDDDYKKDQSILTIYYKVNNIDALISANHTEDDGILAADHKNTTMFHAEVTNSDDAVIASDWAMLYENAVKPVAIAWNEEGAKKVGDNHADYCNPAPDSKLYPELYKNPYEALKAPSSLSIGFNDKKGIDLYDLIEIHMVGLNEDQECEEISYQVVENPKHASLTLAEAEAKYGLTVKFTPVSYETEEVAGTNASGNKTQPSNYINPALGAKGHVVAGIVKASDGSFDKDATSYTKENDGVSSVDKQPLVQVLVMKGNDVVLEGYIKLKITRSTENKVTEVIDLGKNDYACAGLDYAMSWYQASTLILEHPMEMGKLEFDMNYKLVTMADGKCAVQYSEPKDDATIDLKNMYAIIYEGPDPEGTTNTVLHVALDQYAQQYILEEKGGEADFIVKYAPKYGDNNVHQYEPGIFVRLHVKIEETPVLLTMSTKIKKNWYKTGVEIDGESTSEWVANEHNTLRLNVNKPDDNKNTYDNAKPEFKDAPVEGFVRDIRDMFEVYEDQNDVVLTAGDFVATTANNKTMFYFHPAVDSVKFVGDDNLTYILSVTNDFVVCNKWVEGDGPEAKFTDPAHKHRQDPHVLSHQIENISAKPLNFIETVAQENKLDKGQGIFLNDKLYVTIMDGANIIETVCVAELNTETGEIWYKHNIAAQKLLNATSYTKAKARAYVGVYSYNDCQDVLAVKDGVFPAYFLRPLDMNPVEDRQVVDAKSNGDLAKLSDLATFKDWRDEEITPAKNGWLLAYYGVNKVTIDLTKITTDLNDYPIESKLLTEVTKKAKFSLVEIWDDGTVNTLATMDSTPYTKEVADLSEYDKESAKSEDVFKAVFDGLALKYENNGFNIYNWKVRVPVTLGYDWGEFQTYVTVEVVKTLGTQE